MTRKIFGLVGAAALIVTASASAQSSSIQIVGGGDPGTPGWDQPPTSLGGRIMTPYDTFDPFLGAFQDTNVATADAAVSHQTFFSSTMNHRTIGAGWATWSGGYNGSVYYTNGATEVTLTFSVPTKGFYFFFEPNPFETHDFEIVATDADGGVAFMSQSADGSAGATWAGVFSVAGGGITSIRISSEVDFALGRFGYNLIPTPGAFALLGLAGFAGRRRRA